MIPSPRGFTLSVIDENLVRRMKREDYYAMRSWLRKASRAMHEATPTHPDMSEAMTQLAIYGTWSRKERP